MRNISVIGSATANEEETLFDIEMVKIEECGYKEIENSAISLSPKEPQSYKCKLCNFSTSTQKLFDAHLENVHENKLLISKLSEDCIEEIVDYIEANSTSIEDGINSKLDELTTSKQLKLFQNLQNSNGKSNLRISNSKATPECKVISILISNSKAITNLKPSSEATESISKPEETSVKIPIPKKLPNSKKIPISEKLSNFKRISNYERIFNSKRIPDSKRMSYSEKLPNSKGNANHKPILNSKGNPNSAAEVDLKIKTNPAAANLAKRINNSKESTDQAIICRKCSLPMSSQNMLNVHLLGAHGSNAEFKDSTIIKDYIRRSPDNYELSYVCSSCNFTSLSVDGLKLHLRVLHGLVESIRLNDAKKYVCPTCNFVAYSEEVRDDHMMIYHQSKTDVKNTAYLNAVLLYHGNYFGKPMATRFGPKPYGCEICKMRFRNLWTFWKHNREDHGLVGLNVENAQTFSCLVCAHGTYSREAMERHVEHHKERIVID